MNDPALRQLALDIVDDKVFGSWMVEDPSTLHLIFPTLLFLDAEQRGRAEQYAHCYEYMASASSTGVNGKPMFFSMRFLTAEEWDKVRTWAMELVEQRKVFLTQETQ